MSAYAYYNGSFDEYGKIRLPLSDRAVFFGDGVYDAAVGEAGAVFRYEEHFERFKSNAEKIGLKFDFNKARLFEIFTELIRLSELKSYFLYFQLSAYGRERAHERKDAGANLLVTVKPWCLPSERGEISLCTAKDIRYSLCNIKTLNILPAVLFSTKAREGGFDECVFLRGVCVTECAHSNVFIIKNGVLRTAPAGEAVLAGITRKIILTLAEESGIKSEISHFTYRDMLEADDVFISSTSKLCQHVKRINNRKMPSKSSVYTELCHLLYEHYRSCFE